MCRIENAHDRLKRVECFAGGELTTLLDLGVERITFDVLHHHVDGTVSGSAEVVNCYCVRMAKTTGGLTFSPKTTKPLSISADLHRQDLYCNTIAQENMASAINGPHSTLS